jgi:class 3 adenylate cyclase
VPGGSETRYALADDGVSLAYQVFGDGLVNLVFVRGGPGPIDLMWDDPGFIRASRRLSTFSRTLWLEPRGQGASEGELRDSAVAEIFDADLIAVLDAAGFEDVAIVGEGVRGKNAIHFAVAHAERVSALVLLNTFAYFDPALGTWGRGHATIDELVTHMKGQWGTSAQWEVLAPSRSTDERLLAWSIRAQHLGTGPEQWGQYLRALDERDLRPLLPAISVPTLVLHREGNRNIPLGAGKFLAEHIAGATFVVLHGDEHPFFVGDTDALVEEIEEFLTGCRQGAEGEILTATVLFTDIVGSTELQARMGQRKWSRLTDDHDALVRAALVRHRGHEVKTIGDAFLATFDATGRAIRCAAEVVAGAKGIGLELRAGLHTGEVEVRGDDIAGLAVNIAKRICDMAGPCQVLVSETVRTNMVGSGIEFADRGEHQLRGVPGMWRLYAITD